MGNTFNFNVYAMSVDDCNGPLVNQTTQNHDRPPFLGREASSDGGQTSIDQKLMPKDSAKSSIHLVLYFMAIHFLLAYCELILVAPLIELFEQSLCATYYETHDPSVDVPELMCKIQAIQAPLATIRGWKSLFDTIPVLVITVPFGKLADRYGRRKLMAICLFGVTASFSEVFVVCAFPRLFPLQLVWLSSLILLCGGGLYSAAALMWAMAAEAFPEEKRSQAFYYIFAAFYIAELVGSFTAAVTIDISPWISCALSATAILGCLLLLWVMPEPQRPTRPISADDEDTTTHHSEGSSLLMTKPPPSSPPISGIRSALSNKNTLLAIPVFLTGSLRFTILNVLIQYASARFHLHISTGALFYTETAIVNMLLFLLAVPALSKYLHSTHRIRPAPIDLFMSRTCVALLCLGSLLIGLSPTSTLLPVGVFVFAAGFGSRVSTLALVSHWVQPGSEAALYAAVAVVENVGHALGDPALQQIFAAALRLSWSPFWQAMPFFAAAVLYCAAGLSTLFIEIGDDGGGGGVLLDAG